MMEEKFFIKDDSDLRKYYTVIPNCVLNGSGIYEQAMYAEMKRFAGEKGKCFASIRTMTKRLGIGEHKVIETIQKLIKRGWIEKIESRKTDGRPVNQYKIVDIWAENMKIYSKKKG